MTASRVQLSNLRIAGVGVMLFSAILLGVGIHHLIATGNCSSTGYSSDLGPVPYCPSGTGYWFAFVFGGIIGCLIGAAMATSLGLVFAGTFGAVGVGSLTLVLDHVHGGERVFAVIFGGGFALVGLIALVATLQASLGSLRAAGAGARPPLGGRSRSRSRRGASTSRASSRHVSTAAGFGAAVADSERLPAPAATLATAPTPIATTASPTPGALLPGLMAARDVAVAGPVDDLAKLAELHGQGALTDDEFATAKAKLLAGM
jgi:hypothetical protein